MEILVASSTAEAETVAVDRLLEFISENPTGKLGVATGRTFEGIYSLLVERAARYGAPLHDLSLFLLDEYLGLERDHPQRFRNVIFRQLADPAGIARHRVFGPDADGLDPDSAGPRYDRLIEDEGGVQLQLLGIGRAGHIGFNEPGSALRSRTRKKVLTSTTRNDNAESFGDAESVPPLAITQGIATILGADQLMVVATGERKAAIVRDALEGPITASVPASVVQFHEATTVVLDAAAASRLDRLDYYRTAHPTTGGSSRTADRPALEGRDL